MKKGLVFFLSILIFLSWCGGKTEDQTLWSGEVATWIEAAPVVEHGESFSSWGVLSWGHDVVISWTVQTGNNQWGSWTVSAHVKKRYFKAELCDQIVKFNLCVITKAPIENQPVMKKKLQEALSVWRKMADTQLNEICKDIVSDEVFLEVVEHYEEQGCVF